MIGGRRCSGLLYPNRRLNRLNNVYWHPLHRHNQINRYHGSRQTNGSEMSLLKM